MAFAKEQPEDGDTILHCGHWGRDEPRRYPVHWFKYPEQQTFVRPDGTRGEATWFAACQSCLARDGEKITNFPRGDIRWIGDEPAIQKVVEN